jgi:hypothetical protein
MQKNPAQIARDRLQELAADPRYRPYIVGYLLSCLDERHWAALVEAALEYGEGLVALQEASEARARELAAERG